MYSRNPKYAEQTRKFIAQHTSKIREILSNGEPKRFTQIMTEADLGRSQTSQALKAMEFSGEIQVFLARDPNANHATPVTWFQLHRQDVNG